MDSAGFQFDLATQRFIKGRWETEVGSRVREELIDAIKSNVEIRGILDPYVLNHPENVEPYGYPIYPSSEMSADAFWVLTSDDLRGIRVYNEDFPSSRSLEKKSLSYSYFFNCKMDSADLYMSDLSYASFEECSMDEVIIVDSGGFELLIKNCSMRDACLWNSGFRGCDFSGSDFRGVYLEGSLIEGLKVNYATRFDLNINMNWNRRKIPDTQLPDIYRSLRLAFEKAEIWNVMDQYIFREKRAYRKAIAWKNFKNNRSLSEFTVWALSLMSSLFSGYSTRPSRVAITSFAIFIFFSLTYFLNGPPSGQSVACLAALESIYFSATTFVTLGYGDIHYSANQPYMRIWSTVEAWVGAASMSLFVVVLGRKVFR